MEYNCIAYPSATKEERVRIAQGIRRYFVCPRIPVKSTDMYINRASAVSVSGVLLPIRIYNYSCNGFSYPAYRCDHTTPIISSPIADAVTTAIGKYNRECTPNHFFIPYEDALEICLEEEYVCHQ